MRLSRDQILGFLEQWNQAWEAHDLEGVLAGFSEDVVFENWTGGRVQGLAALRQAWGPWFTDHGGFRFVFEDLFADAEGQKALYRWALHWPSPEKGFQGQPEVRRGVDVLHFRDGKIAQKYTYCKTTVEISGQRVRLTAG